MEVRGENSTVGEPLEEDPQVVLDLLEAGLLAFAADWAANVLPGNKVTIDTSNTT